MGVEVLGTSGDKRYWDPKNEDIDFVRCFVAPSPAAPVIDLADFYAAEVELRAAVRARAARGQRPVGIWPA
jgi:hypothetical protein